jgi:hypothetical protein
MRRPETDQVWARRGGTPGQVCYFEILSFPPYFPTLVMPVLYKIASFLGVIVS